MKFITFFVGLLETVMKLCDKYGIVKTITYTIAFGMLSFFIYTGICIITLDKRIDTSVTRALKEQTSVTEQVHADGIEKRMGNLENINNLLKETMYEVGADRASVIEMHNGTNNTAGLPFLYGEMTYEQVRRGIEHVDDNYAKMNLTRYIFPTYMMEKNYFRGTIDSAMDIDEKIATKMSHDGTTYVIAYTLYGDGRAIGFFIVTWSGEKSPQLTSDDLSKISVTAQKISNMLYN